MELGLQEHEPTVLEYARFHGICRDYTHDQSLTGSTLPSPGHSLDLDLRDPFDAPSITNPASELTKERLTVSKETALFLRTVLSIPEPLDEAPLISNRRRRSRGLKQEIPLLHSDNELDLLNFGNTAVPDFSHLKIPLAPVDEANDEGFEWPLHYSACLVQCEERAKTEKIAVSRDVLKCLQDAVRDSYMPEDAEAALTDSLSYKKNVAVQPLTPPLLPMSPPMTPYIPSSPGNCIELLSEDSNSVVAEAKALENQLMTADALTCDSKEDDLLPLDIADLGQSDPIPNETEAQPLKRKAEHLQIEGPLTPPMFSESPAKKFKSVSFSNFNEYIPVLPSQFENGDDILGPEDDFNAFYKDIIPLAEEAVRKVESEKLSAADTIKRVSVPHIDFTLPIAPWDEYQRISGKNPPKETELEAQMKFMLHVKRIDMHSVETWHGLSKLTRELPLAPFPTHAAKVTIEEKLHGEQDLNEMLSELTLGNDVVASSDMIWKRNGLRILEESEDEDELEPEEGDPAELEDTMDMDVLVRKRKLEIEEAAGDAESNRKYTFTNRLEPNDRPQLSQKFHHTQGRKLTMPTVPTKCWSNTKDPPNRREQTDIPPNINPQSQSGSDQSLMFGGKFSATNALEHFMAMRGKGKGSPETTESTRCGTDRSQGLSKPPPDRLGRHVVEQRLAFPKPQEPPPPAPTLPELPSVPEDLSPCSFIVSSSLLQQRSLMKQIEKLYPNAEFVSRDFDLPHSPAKEADLLLSPSTGLIMTTLQQIKQRALPGQPDRSPIKERIRCLHYRYERLVVVISEGLRRDMEEQGSGRPVDARDQEAIREFEKFTMQIEGDVLIKYVPGGERSLACLVVGEMATYGLAHGSKDIGDIKPLADQTNWEVFLCRAGLNPFAAQVILAWLKGTVDYPLASSSPIVSGTVVQTVPVFGLQTFLMMPAEQRIESFQAVLGGSRILRGVSKVLDQEWLSASHGFRM